MTAKTNRWKNAERQGAEIANKFLIDAERITRAGNYSVSTYDISLRKFPEYKIDSKYSQAGFKTNRMLEVVRDKYCKDGYDIPVLLTKGYRENGMKASVDADFFFMILSYWLSCGTKEELEKIYFGY